MVGGLILCGCQSLFLDMVYRREPDSQEEPDRRHLRKCLLTRENLIPKPALN